MSKRVKTYFKIVLDVLMAAAYFSLMFGYGTGALFHELAGIAVGVLFAAHLALNVDFIKSMVKKAGNGGTVAAIGAVLDLVLVIFMPVAIFTGILISGPLFDNDMNMSTLLIHNIASWIGAAAIAAHIVMHARYIVSVVKGMLKNRAEALRAAAMGVPIAAAFLIVCLAMGRISKDEGVVAVGSDYSSADAPAIVAQADTQTDNDEPKITSAAGDQEIPTLSEYLGRLFCNGCGRHCSLLAPQCGKGQMKAQSAQTEYYTLYGTADGDASTQSTPAQDSNTAQSDTTPAQDGNTAQSDTTPAQDNDAAQGGTTAQSGNTAQDGGAVITDQDGSAVAPTATIAPTPSAQADVPTLNEYLGNLFCNGCGRRCSLLSPHCGKGERQAQTAQTEYNNQYGTQE